MRKSLETFVGQGQVRFAGRSVLATYVIEGDPQRLRRGPVRLRGRLVTGAEAAEAAFRASEGALLLESGVELLAVMLAHSAGGCEVFVELRA